ncbi:hypothetical protein [Lactococcus petauri]|uniref:hypothetical protein n=1 Tax=Lactococcus petauri TaxID=1940789 RepID=UPI0031FF112B
MTPEKKRKLRNIALLAILGLLGGTFAFTAFNQQAINDREVENRADVGGRVHDYFDGDENKDVFVENFGQQPILVRLQLSEFMEIQARGSNAWTPVTPGEREDLDTWTTYIPEVDNVSQRRSNSPSAAFNTYSNLTFGYEYGNVSPPWYLPTFNTEYDSDTSAASGHARDLSDGLENSRATHPGAGTANFWSQGETYTNSGQWPGQTITRETAQNLYQDSAPITLHQWNERLEAYMNQHSDGRDLIGNFWVMDEATGWAYYAIALQAGEASSYLLDASHMTEAAHNIQGSYYYGVHVKSELIGTPSPFESAGLEQTNDIPRFQDEPAHDGFDGALGDFLNLVRMTTFDNINTDLPDFMLDRFFESVQPGQRFTTSGEQFMYLGFVGEGLDPEGRAIRNHMIIRSRTFKNISWNDQPTALASWYAGLNADLKARVQPVVIPARDEVPGVSEEEGVYWTDDHPGWINHNPPPPVGNDITRVNLAGTPQAFALSMVDVSNFSSWRPDLSFSIGRPFETFQSRVAGDGEWWFTRTPAGPDQAWGIDNGTHGPQGGFVPGPRAQAGNNGGVRPALIIQARADMGS